MLAANLLIIFQVLAKEGIPLTAIILLSVIIYHATLKYKRGQKGLKKHKKNISLTRT